MKKSKDLVKYLGSSEPFAFVREAIEEVEKRMRILNMTKVFHIRPMDIESFQKEIEMYSKKHPDAKIKATAFVFSSEEPKKKVKKYKYDSGC